MISDGGATRHSVLSEVQRLVDLLGVPYFTTGMGKGGVDETKPKFGGVYAGMGSKADVREAVENSDCVIWVGYYPSDFNAGEFTDKVKSDVVTEIERFPVSIGEGKKLDLRMKWTLQRLN